MKYTVVIQVYKIDNGFFFCVFFFPFTEGSVLKAESCNCWLLQMPLAIWDVERCVL